MSIPIKVSSEDDYVLIEKRTLLANAQGLLFACQLIAELTNDDPKIVMKTITLQAMDSINQKNMDQVDSIIQKFMNSTVDKLSFVIVRDD
jgi:hypothetical protein